MPVFNTRILTGGKQFGTAGGGGGGGYSSTMAGAELDILEDLLNEDGQLNEGDYKILMKKANELIGRFNLGTSSGRNAVATLQARISGYNLDMKNKENRKITNVDFMNESLEDDRRKITKIFSNDPKGFIEKNALALQSKLENLRVAINNGNEAGNDITNYVNEFNSTLTEWGKYNDLLDQVNNENFEGIGVYVKTDGRGRVIDIDYAREGESRIGNTIETDSKLAGKIPINIVPNGQKDGSNFAKLGNQIFLEDPHSTPVPIFDSQGKVTGLVSYKLRNNTGSTEIGNEQLSYTTYLNQDQWAKGMKGDLYKNVDGVNYTKYVNYPPDLLGLNENDLVPLDSEWEKRINNQVTSTELPMTKMPELEQQKIFSSKQQNEQFNQPSSPQQSLLPSPQASPFSFSGPQSLPRSTPEEPNAKESVFKRVKSIFTGNF